MNNSHDRAYMRMAYSLAGKALGWTSPNPYVGAVVVKGRRILGCGYHEKPGRPHAEAAALDMAGAQARGSTLYLTLEPCTHWGRTPPCVDKILESGVKRAVISDLDPNPVVHSRGVEKMKAAGIQVQWGLMKERNRRLNEAYFKFITRRIPFVTLKAALSLDGKLAARTGDSQWISGKAARNHIHLLRGEHDAVLVGAGTLLADKPRLTVRHPSWGNKPITRVVLDSALCFPLDAPVLKTQKQGDILVYTLSGADSEKVRILRDNGVKVIPLQDQSHPLNLQEILRSLGGRGISSVLVEGGGRIHTSFLDRRLADKALFILSPMLIGGRLSPGLYQGEGAGRIKNALRLKHTRIFQLQEDLIMEGYF
ncbi:MAG: bifunctional diaminohydroxyphosphoribosylaminopyrimidine deaminase/5-amino-6-(5-phosphoribosylamino)uracil reductase RibD [Candidatus Aminicenantes bacterium]